MLYEVITDVTTGLPNYSETPVDITNDLATFGVTVIEDCNFTVTYVDSQTGECPWIITRTFTATDDCGNVGTAVQTITIDDTTPPVVTAPAVPDIEACDVTNGLPDYSETDVDITGNEAAFGLNIVEACNYTTSYVDSQAGRITSYNVCYTKLLRAMSAPDRSDHPTDW